MGCYVQMYLPDKCLTKKNVFDDPETVAFIIGSIRPGQSVGVLS
jgi:hypothetical protein